MDFIIFTLCNILYSNEFATLAHNVGIAGLTILIPLAILVFQDKDFGELDKHVVLDHVTQAQKLLIYLALIFIPLLFWENSITFHRFVELILWMTGIGFLIRVLFNSYKWLKGNKFPLRFSYLRTMKNKKDMEESWSSVWSTENTANEVEFFDIFTERVDKLLENHE